MVGQPTPEIVRVESVTRAILGDGYDQHYQHCLVAKPAGPRFINERTGKQAHGYGVDFIVDKGDRITCLSCGARWECDGVDNGQAQWRFIW